MGGDYGQIISMEPTELNKNRPLGRKIAEVVLLGFFLFTIWYSLVPFGGILDEEPSITTFPWEAEKRKGCFGPRGKFILKNKDDKIEEKVFDPPPEEPMIGSYEALNLKQTWASADGRYAPYGRGQNKWNYGRTKVNWRKIDWGKLQSQCIERNQHRFGSDAHPITSDRRMAYPTAQNSQKIRVRNPRTTNRTAIVLRGWEEFVFHEPNNWFIRSMVAETALATGGDYAVFILVDIHDRGAKIFKSKKNYDKKLAEIVPPEYRNMAVLFDKSLLKAWYPKTKYHDMRFQNWQPLQIFAHFFDDFDHYWHLEMDMRFLGHTGRILDSFAEAARNEPRKQARERASYMFTPRTYGTYENLTAQVNNSLNGGSAYWTGIRIPDVEPIGPSPPVSRAEDDPFEWGVGEEADYIALGACTNMTFLPDHKDWKKYTHNFKLGPKTPRMFCPPSMGRVSWNLLNGIHNLQIEKGLEIPSEAHMPSFTLWMNLKISKIPFPMFGEGHPNADYIDRYMNGNRPEPQYGGMARVTRKFWKIQNPVDRPQVTWRSTSSYAKRAFFAWLEGSPHNIDDGKPQMLQLHKNKFYAPNCILHPAKFNTGFPGAKVPLGG